MVFSQTPRLNTIIMSCQWLAYREELGCTALFDGVIQITTLTVWTAEHGFHIRVCLSAYKCDDLGRANRLDATVFLGGASRLARFYLRCPACTGANPPLISQSPVRHVYPEVSPASSRFRGGATSSIDRAWAYPLGFRHGTL